MSLITVLLLKASDSTLIKSSITKERGNFIFEDVKEGGYLISVSSVGYQKYFTAAFTNNKRSWQQRCKENT